MLYMVENEVISWLERNLKIHSRVGMLGWDVSSLSRMPENILTLVGLSESTCWGRAESDSVLFEYRGFHDRGSGDVRSPQP